jgi:hypothetical protein
MALSIWWNRLDAPRWAGRLLVVQTVLVGYLALIALVAGAAAGLLWPAVVLLVVTFLLGGLTSAWYAERPWAWHVLCASEVLGLLWELVAAAGQSPFSTALRLILSLVSIALLLHPATRTRLEPPAPREPARWRAPSDQPRH